MHPTEKLTQLRALARECQGYQLERGWSDTQMCREIAHLGSTKTYKRILDDTDALDELNLDNQLKSYTAAVEYIALRRGKDRPAEVEYEDFENVTNGRAAIARALSESSIARFIVIEGESGTGKDAVKNALLRNWGKITVSVEATELWRESLNVPLGDIINAASIRRSADENGEKFKLPTFPSARLELIIDEFSKRRLILLINEAHHMGPRGLNMVKTLINQTEVVPVFMCVPKLLARLITGAYEEAIQLFGNRLCERVRLNCPQPSEIMMMFERRGVEFASATDLDTAAKAVAADAPTFGNWRYVVQVTREARDGSGGRPLTLAQFSKAATTVRSRRVTNQTAQRRAA